MATISPLKPSALRQERIFFFMMALVMTAVTIVGFLRFLAIGLSSFDSPWWVHVHGVTMMGWLLLYLAQNGLVARGNLALHRNLGMLTAAWSVGVVAVGVLVLAYNAKENRAPPFFPGAFMYALDGFTVIAFAGLTWAGLALRDQSDWHKRLMLGGTILLIQPGLGRLIPRSLLGTDIPYLLFPAHLLLFAAALFFDWRTQGRVHPAYMWGLGALVLATVLPAFVATAPPLVALVDSLKG